MLEPLRGEKFQRALHYQRHHPRKKKMSGTNRHHLTNQCRGGKTVPSNILVMKRDRHALLHRYFRNLSWEEITDVLKGIFGTSDPHKAIEVMERISRIKGRVA